MKMHTQKRHTLCEGVSMCVKTHKRDVSTHKRDVFTHIKDLFPRTHTRDVSTHKRDDLTHKRRIPLHTQLTQERCFATQR